MTNDALERLGERIDEAFLLIGLAILVIEIAKGFFDGKLTRRGFADMVASISTQIPFIAFEILIMTGAYGLFFVASETFVSWTFPVTIWTVVLAVLVADFLYYWEHRLAHEIRVLWLQHAVHHSSRYMNITTAFRFGPFEGIWSAIVLFPMVLVGFPPELVFFGTLAVLAYQTWLHTELIGKLGLLEWVLNTPSHHRVHHGSDDAYLDKNYGGILIIWDRMFGSFQLEEVTPRYGLKRDFDSVNPLVVWISELPTFFREVAGARSGREAWMRIFGRPDWKPAGTPDAGEG